MFDLFGKIEEFFKDIMIDIIKDNLSAMLVDINDIGCRGGGEGGKSPGFLGPGRSLPSSNQSIPMLFCP